MGDADEVKNDEAAEFADIGTAAQKQIASAARSKILHKVSNFCHYWLNFDREVLGYLRATRHISDETIIKFRLGAFPPIPQLLTKFSEFDLQVAGIIKKNDAGDKLTSKFSQNRLITPIQDLYGRTIAIMGRTLLPESEQVRLGVNKYDGTIFPKSRCLYGLNTAIETIREKNAVLVVEGCFDVISAHQAGIKNVVGSMGAFLHSNQIALLARYTDKIKLGFDADEAGERATQKVMKKKISGIEFGIKSVPSGYKDWDEYFRTRDIKPA